jgi:hypothetical protein
MTTSPKLNSPLPQSESGRSCNRGSRSLLSSLLSGGGCLPVLLCRIAFALILLTAMLVAPARAHAVTLSPGQWSYQSSVGTLDFTVDSFGKIGDVSLSAYITSSWFGNGFQSFVIPASKITETSGGFSGSDQDFHYSSIGWYNYSGSITATKVGSDNVTGSFTVGRSDSSPHSAGKTVTFSILRGGPDTTPPTITISSPSNNQAFGSSTVSVTGTASDPGSPSAGVVAVEVRVNGGTWLTANGTTSWSISIPLLANGNTIEARSRDGATNYSTVAMVTVVKVPCSYTLSVTSASHGSTTAARFFSVTANSGCSWSAAANQTWLHTTSSGSGSGTVYYTLDVNPYATFRTGTVTVGGQAFTVTQGPAGFAWETVFGWLFDAGGGWYHHDGLGWLWFSSGQWIWSSSIKGWVATMDSSRTLWSTQFRWLTPSATDPHRVETTALGTIYVGKYNGADIPDGWVVSERFGYVWANGDGVWFWSNGMQTWLGVTPDGSIWSVNQGRFL